MPTFIREVPIGNGNDDHIGVARSDGMRELVPVGDVFVPPAITVELFGSDDPPAQPAVFLDIEVRSGVPVCTRVEVQGKPGGREVTANDVLIVKGQLHYWVTEFTSFCAVDDPEVIGRPTDGRTAQRAVDGARKRARRKVTHELLAGVAKVYRAHVDGHPVKAVESAYAVSERTAARYVELCRSDEHQLLPKTTQGRKQA